MNCNQITPLIIEHVDGTLDELQNQAVIQHAKNCNLCKNQIRYEQRLQHSLKILSLAEAPENFCDNAFKEIEKRDSRQSQLFAGISSAIAASLAMWLIFSPAQQIQPQLVPQSEGIEIAVNNFENIRVSFEAPDDFKRVTLTVNLPEQIELKGFPGKRRISWETSLNSGSNILTLPVIARSAGKGIVEAKISNKHKSKSFKIQMTAKPDNRAGMLTSA